MAKRDIIKTIAPILDIIIFQRKALHNIADDLDTIFDEGDNGLKDMDRINNLFAAVDCLKEAEKYISQS